MRIFVAGASGVIGIRLLPLLVSAGHEVVGMTRSEDNAVTIARLGADAVIGDVYDTEWLTEVLGDVAPDVVIDLLTDLPDDARRLPDALAANARMRTEGTDSLLAALATSGADRLLAESVAWELSGASGDAVRHLEAQTLAAGGVVLRYGQLYGPGTYHQDQTPDHPRIHVEEAARITAQLLDAPSGIVEIVEPADGP